MESGISKQTTEYIVVRRIPHCRKYALSDLVDSNFKQDCDHEHSLMCQLCEDLKDLLNDLKQEILQSCTAEHNREYQEDLLHDFEQAKSGILEWKAHVLRSVNQNKAKHNTISNLSHNSVLVVMDWAMKFVEIKYREKQSDWYGKRGMRWHVSTVISKEAASSSEVEVQTYAHLFDNCQQDWFAVCSIFENLLTTKPSVNSFFFGQMKLDAITITPKLLL